MLTLLAGCGVKSDPRPPVDSLLPSIGSEYLISPKQKKTDEEKKKKLEKEEKKKKQ